MADGIPRWLSLVVAVATVVGVVIGALAYFGSPAQHLDADVAYSDFVMPPTFQSGDFIDSLLSKENTLRDLDPLFESGIDVPDKLLTKVHSNTVAGLRSRFASAAAYGNFGMRGQYIVSIRNSGQKLLDDVTLTVPDDRMLICIQTVDSLYCPRAQSQVRIGNMIPREQVTAYVWAHDPGSEYDAEKFELAHASGLGRVHVRRPVGAIWQWLDEWWGAIMLPAVLFGLALLALAAEQKLKRAAVPSGVAAATDDAPAGSP